MKPDKLIPFLLILVSLGNFSSAQVTSRNYLHYENIEDIKARTLLVEVLKEDPKYIETLQNAGKAADVANYKKNVSSYNYKMKKFVGDYWKLNADIQFKDEDEIKAIPEADKKNYALLLFTELDDATTDVFDHNELQIPCFLYHRADKPLSRPDVKLPLPSSHARDKGGYEESDIIIALMLLQDEVNTIEKDQPSNFKTYFKNEAEKNCAKLKGKTLSLDEAIAAKDFKPEDVKATCALEILMVDAGKINDAIYNNLRDGIEVLLTVPVNINKPAPVKGVVSNTVDIMYAKIVVDLKTYKVLNAVMPNSNGVHDCTFKSVDFKKICQCAP